MPRFDQHSLRQGKRPLGVTIIATWFLLSGGLAMLSGGIMLTMLVVSIFPSLDSDSTGMGGIVALIFGLGGVLGLLLGLTYSIAGLGLLKMKRWGIWSCITISALSVILNCYGFLSLFLKAILRFSITKETFTSAIWYSISLAITITIVRYLIAFQRSLTPARFSRSQIH
jgi:hypothetical protein